MKYLSTRRVEMRTRQQRGQKWNHNGIRTSSFYHFAVFILTTHFLPSSSLYPLFLKHFPTLLTLPNSSLPSSTNPSLDHCIRDSPTLRSPHPVCTAIHHNTAVIFTLSTNKPPTSSPSRTITFIISIFTQRRRHSNSAVNQSSPTATPHRR
jgi:hypothetical protein